MTVRQTIESLGEQALIGKHFRAGTATRCSEVEVLSILIRGGSGGRVVKDGAPVQYGGQYECLQSTVYDGVRRTLCATIAMDEWEIKHYQDVSDEFKR